MTSLVNRRQVAAKIESTVGTAETIAATDNIPQVRSVTVTPNVLRIERPTVRQTLTRYPDLIPGQTGVEVVIECEIAGDSTNSSGSSQFAEPQWSSLIKSCGFGFVSSVVRISYNGTVTSGPMRHGETIDQTTSGAQGTCVGDYFTGDRGVIYIEETSGSFTGTGAHTLTGATSGATITPTGINSYNPGAWRLESDIDTMGSCTIQVHTDGKIWKVKGCRGTVEFSFAHGNVILATFTMQGVFVSYADGALLTSPDEAQYNGPTFIGANLSVDDGTNTYDQATSGAILNTVTLATNNDVILRENSLDASGIDFAFITGRTPGGSFNPDEVLNTTYDFISNLTGGTNTRMLLEMGSTVGNKLVFGGGGCLFTASSDTDRDGVYVLDMTFQLGGGDYGSGTTGTDNEIVIINE